jgi:hypothetical protein
MRHLVWLSSVLLVLSCSVDNSNLNVDAGGSAGAGAGGAGGCPRCVGTGGAAGRASGGATGASGGATGTGGATAGTTGTGGSATGAGGTATAGATGTGGAASGGQTGTGGSVAGAGGGGGNPSGTGGTGNGGRKGGGGDSGLGGATGTGGGKGQGGQGGAASCDALATDYSNAMTAAKKCTPGAAGQCQQMVDSALSACAGGCKTYVNDATMLSSIEDEWNAAGCASMPHGACPAIACVVPGPSTCTGTSSTPGGPGAGADPSGTCTSSLVVTPVTQ